MPKRNAWLLANKEKISMNGEQRYLKHFLLRTLWVVMLAFTGSVAAHDGPLDENGCHKDSRDYYHCH